MAKAPTTSETMNRTPVCGCNGLVYWNLSVARSHAMAIKAGGTCPSQTCGGFAGLQCPSGASCDYKVNNATACNISDQSGSCIVTPTTCLPPVIGSLTRACGAPTCLNECALVKSQTTWHPDNTCPQ